MIDPTGHGAIEVINGALFGITIGIFAVAIGVAISASGGSFAEGVQKGWETGTRNLKKGIENVAKLITTGVISGTITRALDKVKEGERHPEKKKERHDIVPKAQKGFEPARDILEEAGIGLNSKINIVPINYDLHRHLHTTKDGMLESYKTMINTKMALAKKKADVAFEEAKAHMESAGYTKDQMDATYKAFLASSVTLTLGSIKAELKRASDIADKLTY